MKNIVIAAAVAVAAASPASATVLNSTSGGLTSSTNLIDFNGQPSDMAPIADFYAANGATFVGLNRAGSIALTTEAPGCSTCSTFTINFTSAVTDASFYFLVNGGANTILTSYLGETLVETAMLTLGNEGLIAERYLGFTGSDFDRIVVTPGGFNSFAVVDDLRFNVPTSDVPEPAMLGLFGLGAIGLGFARRPSRRTSGA